MSTAMSLNGVLDVHLRVSTCSDLSISVVVSDKTSTRPRMTNETNTMYLKSSVKSHRHPKSLYIYEVLGLLQCYRR